MVETLQNELRRRGYRLTPQRQLVLDAVRELRHATPEEIATRVKVSAPGVNITTVYRTLELLEELDLVTHTHLGHGAPTYHTTQGDPHLHTVCRDCGAVAELPLSVASGLAATMEREHGFAVDLAHMAIFGRCANCRAGADTGEA